MTYGPLLDWQPPAQRHSDTSVEAAEAIASRAPTLRAIVLAWLYRHGPASDETMQEALSMGPSTQRPRRVSLVDDGWVVDTGERTKTRSGRSAVLWRALVEVAP